MTCCAGSFSHMCKREQGLAGTQSDSDLTLACTSPRLTPDYTPHVTALERAIGSRCRGCCTATTVACFPLRARTMCARCVTVACLCCVARIARYASRAMRTCVAMVHTVAGHPTRRRTAHIHTTSAHVAHAHGQCAPMSHPLRGCAHTDNVRDSVRGPHTPSNRGTPCARAARTSRSTREHSLRASMTRHACSTSRMNARATPPGACREWLDYLPYCTNLT